MMGNWTEAEYRALGSYLMRHLNEATANVRQKVAEENRGHAVSKEDAEMFDSHDHDEIRCRAVTLAASNVKRELNL